MITEKDRFFIDLIVELSVAYNTERMVRQALEKEKVKIEKENEKFESWWNAAEIKADSLETENDTLRAENETLKEKQADLENQLTEIAQAKAPIMTDSAAKGEL